MIVDHIRNSDKYLDIDGVIGDFVSHFFDYLSLPDHKPDMWDDPRIRENFHLIMDDHNFWLTMPRINHPIPFEIAGYITSRPCSSEITSQWLKSNDFPEKEVITVPMKGNKGLILKNKMPCVLIDDGGHNYEDCWKEGVPCLLFDTPHNQHITSPYRIFNLNEVCT